MPTSVLGVLVAHAGIHLLGSHSQGLVVPVRDLPAWLRQGVPPIVATPLQIVLIVVIAVAARLAARKLIDGVIHRMVERPLKTPVHKGTRNTERSRGQAKERRRQRAEAVGGVLRSAATIAILTVAVVMVLGTLNINVAPIIASAGIVGLALGFGAQSLVSDFLSGLFMLMEDQYGVGDWVDISGTSGTVEEVGLRVTKLRDLDGAVWYVRNGQVLKLRNCSQDWARAVLDVPVAFDQDIDAGLKALEEAAWSMRDDPLWRDRVVGSPRVWGLTTLTRDEVTMRVSVNTPPADRWDVERELRRRVKDRLGRQEEQTS